MDRKDREVMYSEDITSNTLRIGFHAVNISLNTSPGTIYFKMSKIQNFKNGQMFKCI